MVPAAQAGAGTAGLCPDGTRTGAADEPVTHILCGAWATACADATGHGGVPVGAAVPAAGRSTVGSGRSATDSSCTADPICASIYICAASLGRSATPAEERATVCAATTGHTLWCLAGLRCRWLGFSRGGSRMGRCFILWNVADTDVAGRYVVEHA